MSPHRWSWSAKPAWILALAGCSVLPFARAFGAARTLAWRDTAMLYAPLRPLVVDAVRHFRLPLWNPYEGTGQPLFSQLMHGVLHPVSIAAAFLARSPGMDALLVGYLACAALGAFAAAKAHGASDAGAFVAGVGYGLSGYVVAMTTNLVYLAGAASAPWVIAAMRAAARSGWAALVAAPLAVAACVFSGDVQAVLTSALAGAVLAFEAGRLRGGARALGGAVLGIAIAAVQLVPAISNYADTSRGLGTIGMTVHDQWALSPWRLPELLLPGLFVGTPHSWYAPVFVALGGPSVAPFPWSPSIFLGGALILLALAGARTRVGKVLLGLAVFWLWLALHQHLGARQLLGDIPLWGSFRYAEKLVGPLALAACLGAALGFDALDDQRFARRVRWMAALGGGLCLILALACAAAPSLLEKLWTSAGAGPAASLARDHLGTGAVHATIAFGALATVLCARGWIRRLSLAALVAVESAAALPFACHLGLAWAELAPGLPAFEADPPGPRLLSPLTSNFTEGTGELDAIDRAQLVARRLGYLSTGAAARVDNVDGYTGLASHRAGLVRRSGSLRWALDRRFAVTHVVAPAPADADEEALLREATEGGVRLSGPDADGISVWSVPHRPWAFFASNVRTAPDLRGVLPLLAQAIVGASPDVIVESDEAIAAAPGRVLSVRREVESIAVEAETERDGLLVVADAYDRGWKATLDGAPVRILPADVLVRAVRWPAGRHRLEMHYQPAEIPPGAAVSCAGIAAVLAGATILRLRRRARLTAGS